MGNTLHMAGMMSSGWLLHNLSDRDRALIGYWVTPAIGIQSSDWSIYSLHDRDKEL